MNWIRSLDTKTVAKIFVAVAGLVIGYLGLAYNAGYPPYGHSSVIEMDSPSEGYQFVGDFKVELSGGVSNSDRIWLTAKDSAQGWYPLAEAAVASKGHWATIIRAEQIISPVLLCAVTVNEQVAGEFRSFLQAGSVQQGLPALPSGAETASCRNVQPKKP